MAKGENTVLEGTTKVLQGLADVVPGADIAAKAFQSLSGGASELYDKMTKNAAVIEQYRINLTQANGASSNFIKTLRDQTYDLNKYGVGLAQVVEANIKISEGFGKATFSAAQTRAQFESQRIELQKFVTVNSKFGVSMEESVSFANKLTNSVFQNVGQVSKLSDTLLAFSKGSGQDFKKVMSEFSTYSERFITTLDSEKATRSFTTLELLAKRAGTSVSTLLGSIQKFDDIDESFATGGQINRVLSYFGGSFDTLAAANASEEQLAEMMIESLRGISTNLKQQFTDPKARRSVLKELQGAFGLPPEMIVGILEEKNDLSKDLISMIRTPSVERMQAISEADKAKMAMDVTTKEQAAKIRDENAFIGPLTIALDKFLANQKTSTINASVQVAKRLDGVLKNVTAGNFNAALSTASTELSNFKDSFKNQTGQFIASLGQRGLAGTIDDVGTKFKQNISKLDSDSVQKQFETRIDSLYRAERTQREQDLRTHRDNVTDGVVQGAYRAFSNMPRNDTPQVVNNYYNGSQGSPRTTGPMSVGK